MVKAILNIRFKQIYRSLAGIGPIRVIFLSALVIFSLMWIFSLSAKSPYSIYVSVFFLIIIALIQSKRRDKLFLKSRFANFRLILLVEYLILAMPVISCLIFHSQWITAALLLSALIAVIHFNPVLKHKHANNRILRLIPFDAFEWKAGMRKYLTAIILLWSLGLSASFFVGCVPIVIFILGIITFDFYEENEPLQMILAHEKCAYRFLGHKIRITMSLFTVLTFPLIAAFLIFHSGLWYIPVVEYLIIMSLQIYMILIKYAFYEPGSKPAAARIFGMIGIAGVLIPVFLPLAWILSGYFYIKAKEKLNFYLNDYN